MASADAADRALDADSPDGSGDRLSEAVSEIEAEGERLLNRISVAINRLVYAVPDSAPAGAASAFRKIRRQQIELLSAIGDDIELVRDQVRRSRELQVLFRDQSARLRRAARLMGILRERFVRRPTTLLQLAGPDGKIEELNRTFREINRFEDDRSREMAAPETTDPVNGALGEYRAAADETYADLMRRRDRLRRRTKELIEGRRLLLAIARKGLSPWRRHRVNVLFARHEGRALRFRNRVREHRDRFLAETRPQPL